jgi:hypothetical protein
MRLPLDNEKFSIAVRISSADLIYSQTSLRNEDDDDDDGFLLLLENVAGFGCFRAVRWAASQSWVILSRSNEGRIKVEGFGYRKKCKVGKRRVRMASC